MLMREKLQNLILAALEELGTEVPEELLAKIEVGHPESGFGDYSSNAALIMSKITKTAPKDLAEKIAGKITDPALEKIEVAGPGFINFTLKIESLIQNLQPTTYNLQPRKSSGKILVEYYQPNIAKPLHIGHLRTAVIGDALVRMFKFAGYEVESDTHMGDWGTQFGLLILAYKKYGDLAVIDKDPVTELNKLYIRINQELETDKSIHEAGKQEFVKLEQGDEENRKIWKKFVDWSMEKFLKINDLMDITAFDHHWPESFYEDKMPAVLDKLRAKDLLKESQGAQIVNLENDGLGVAVIVKSDGGTTYLLRDLATFIYRRSLGFSKQLYVVDSRQSHAFRQLFAILVKLDEMKAGEGVHVDYGFMSFKGEVLSTRKGNIVLAEDVIRQAEEKVSAIIEQKNPALAYKDKVVDAVAKGAIKYFDLSHNRHSDIEFDWDAALSFEGNSGPYLQYTYARLASILRKEPSVPVNQVTDITATERFLLFQTTLLEEVVADSLHEYLPNILANYLYGLASLANKFYHESPVIAETDKDKKNFRLYLVDRARDVLGRGLDLLGIKTPEEM